ncbi:MAG: Rieske 2Fe-2S domain-containing protein, partial [Deltaproteobacteria bacterium]|nr:Rieske 2Fe-2S domain-containing protein [Deltaproteobacteria bacterium]
MSAPLDPGLPNARFPFPAYPNGWARVARSEDLGAKGVVPMRYFGRDLVLFRTEAGHARVLDAHCPHLGAHLGVGGTVEGEGLRCPFHAWHWGGDGRCLDVPYAKRIPRAAVTRAWETCERNGFIFIWFHAEGDPASETIPELPE